MARETTLVIGPSGGGKSNFVLTFPKPGLCLDLEGKAHETLPGRTDGWEIKNLVDPPMLEALLMHSRRKSTKLNEVKAKVEAAKTLQVSGIGSVPPEQQPTAFRDLVAIICELHAQSGKYQTIVLDSWTTLNDIANNEVHHIDKTYGLPTALDEYGMLHAKWLTMMPVLVSLPCDHFVLTAHEELTPDEMTKRLYYSPYQYGQKFRPILPRYFSNVFRCAPISKGNELQYVVETRPRGLFTLGKTMHPEIPYVCPADWKLISQSFRKEAP